MAKYSLPVILQDSNAVICSISTVLNMASRPIAIPDCS